MAASGQLLTEEDYLNEIALLRAAGERVLDLWEKEQLDRAAAEQKLKEIESKFTDLETEHTKLLGQAPPGLLQRFQSANPKLEQKVEGFKKILAAVKKAVEEQVDITRGFEDSKDKTEFFKKGPFSIGVIKTTTLDKRITIVNETYEFGQKVKDKSGKRTTAAMNNTKVAANSVTKAALKKEGFNVAEELASAPVVELEDVPVSYYTVTDFEHNYLEWLVRNKVGEDEVRIRSTAMKHLFRFVFGSKKVKDITGFYNQMKIAYSTLEPSEKFPCANKNTQLWEDFRSCLEWRSELALEELVKVRASGLPEMNQTVIKVKELLVGLHALIVQLDRQGGPCFQYSDKEYVTAAEFVDEDLGRLLRIFRNFVREKKDGKAVPSLVELKESVFSKAPMDRSETEQQLYDNLLKLLEWTSGGMPVDKALEKLKEVEKENLELDALNVALLQLLKYANGMWEIKSKIDLLACEAKACCEKKKSIGQTSAELQAELTDLQDLYDQMYADLPPAARQGPLAQQLQQIRTALGGHAGDPGAAAAAAGHHAGQLAGLQQQLAALQQQLAAEQGGRQQNQAALAQEQAGRAANAIAAAGALAAERAAAQQALGAAAAAAQQAQAALAARIQTLEDLLAQPRADPAELEAARQAIAAAEAAAAEAAGRLAATEAERDRLRAADAAKAETIRAQGEALAGAAALLAQKDQDLAALGATGGASAEALAEAQRAVQEARDALALAQANHAAALAAARAETEGVRGDLAAAQATAAEATRAADAQLEAARTAAAAAAREAEEARAAAAAAGPAAQAGVRAALDAAEERARAAEAARADAEAAAAAIRDRAAAADVAEGEARRLAGELDAKTGEATRAEEARAAAAAEAEARAVELAGLRQELANATEAGTAGAAQAAGLQGRVAALEAAQAEADAVTAAAATKAAADAEAMAALRAQLAEQAAAAEAAARAATEAHTAALEGARRARQGELETAIRTAEEATAALAAARAAGGEAKEAAEARVGEANAALELKAAELRALQEALDAAGAGARALEARLGTLSREKGEADAGKAAAERGKAAAEEEKRALEAAIKRLSDARIAAGGQGAALAIDAPLAVLRDELAAVEGDLAAQRAAIAAAEARAAGAEEGRRAAEGGAAAAAAVAAAAGPRIAAAEGIAARAQANVNAAQQRIRELENFAYNLPLVNVEGLDKRQRGDVVKLMRTVMNFTGFGRRSLSYFKQLGPGGVQPFDDLTFDEQRGLLSTQLFGENTSNLLSLQKWFEGQGTERDRGAKQRVAEVIQKFIQVKQTGGPKSAALAAISRGAPAAAAEAGVRRSGAAGGYGPPPASGADPRFQILMERQRTASLSLAEGRGEAAPTAASRAAGGAPSSEAEDLAWAAKMAEGLDAEKRTDGGESGPALAPTSAPPLIARSGSAGTFGQDESRTLPQMDQGEIRRRLAFMIGSRFQDRYLEPRQLRREASKKEIIDKAMEELQKDKRAKLTETYVELILRKASMGVLGRADIRSEDFMKGFFPAMGGGAQSRARDQEADNDTEGLQGPTIPAASTQDLCQTMLLLLLLEASQTQSFDARTTGAGNHQHGPAVFDAQEFLDKAGTTLDALGQCPLVLHVLNELLDAVPEEEGDDLIFKSIPDENEMLPTQLETLSRSLRESYGPDELEVLKRLASPLTLYAQPHEEFQDLLGRKPYFVGGQGPMLKGIEGEDIDVTDEERAKLIPEGDGISLGALRLLYLVCLREVLEGGEIPSPDSKCLAKPKRHRPSSRPRARPKAEAEAAKKSTSP